MPVTQRDQDIMELEDKLRIQLVVEEWRRGFMGERVQKADSELPATLQPEFSQEIENDDSILSGVAK